MEKINYYDPFEFAEEYIDKVFRRGFGLETGMPQQGFQSDVPRKKVKEVTDNGNSTDLNKGIAS